MRRAARPFTALLVMLYFAASPWAQAPAGSIEGTVTDPTGAVITDLASPFQDLILSSGPGYPSFNDAIASRGSDAENLGARGAWAA